AYPLPFGVDPEGGGRWGVGDDLATLPAAEEVDTRILPAAHEEAPATDCLESVESSLPLRKYDPRRLTWMERVNLAVKSVERRDYPALPRRVVGHAVRAAENIAMRDDVDRSVVADREHLVTADVDHPDLTHEDAGVGDVDGSVGSD